MSRTVTVALVGEPGRRDDVMTHEELSMAYSERPAVTLQARDDQKMGELLSEAATRLGVEGRGAERYLPFHMGFYRPEDETEVPPVYSSLLPLVESDGQLAWTWNIPEVTYGQVLRAAGVGAIYGDPARMHIALEPPMGNGIPLDWETVAHIYRIIKEVFDLMAVPGAVAATWAVMRRR